VFQNYVKIDWRDDCYWELRSRLPSVATAIGFNMPGPSYEAERRAMRRVGLNPRNVFAIEKEAGTASAIRRSGQPTITGRLHEVLLSFPPNRQLDFCFADFLGGYGREEFAFSAALRVSPCLRTGAVVIANFMRGRDPYTNERREFFRATARGLLAAPSRPRAPWYEGFMKSVASDAPHRGALMLLDTACSFATWYGQGSAERTGRYLGHALGIARPWLMSYRSESGMYFDTVAFTSWIEAKWDGKRSEMIAALCRSAPDLFDHRQCRKLVGHIAATLAHHTRDAA
jgi:hypothetical protein